MKILKFEAAWCQPCKQMDKVLENILSKNPIAVVQKIDIDVSPDIATEHGIRGIPTLIFMNDRGDELLRLVGTKTQAQVEAAISQID